MGYDFEWAGERALIHPEFGETEIGLRIDGVSHRANLFVGDEPGEAILELDGSRERIWLASSGDVHFVHLRGRAHRVVAINALERARQEAAPAGSDDLLRAPMPGVVVSIAVAPGDLVSRGALLLTIESMKLETAILAPHDARVAEVCVAAGAAFGQDATLIRLEGDDSGGDDSKESGSSNQAPIGTGKENPK